MSPSDQQQSKPTASTAADAGPKPARRRGWRIFFSVFKWCRVALLLAVLSLVLLGLFLNRVGIPQWVKDRIVAQMRAVGWDMEFSRMRLRWYRGIVAEDLQLQRTNAMVGPRLFVETAEFRLNSWALRHFDLHADSVMMQGGRLLWPLPGTNQPRRTFVLNDLRGELFFHPDDEWELRSLQATLLDTRIRLRGSLTNASLVREWKLPERRPPPPGEQPGEFWKRALTEARKFRVIGQPEVSGIFSLDARDFRSLDANLKLTALGLDSPWGGGAGVQLTAHLVPARQSNDPLRVEFKFNADRARSSWVTGTNLQMDFTVEPSFTHWLPTNAAVVAELSDAQSRWGRATRARLKVECQPAPTNAQVRATRLLLIADEAQTDWGTAHHAEIALLAYHSSTNVLPALLESDAQLTQTSTRWATSGWARVSARFPLPAADGQFFKTNLAWAARLQDIPVEAVTTISNLHALRLALPLVTLSNRWQSPQWTSVGSIQAGASHSAINAGLNIETRDLSFEVDARLGSHETAPWVPANAPRWFTDFDWRTPLQLQAQGRLRLPEWTNRAPDWRGDLLPGASIMGRLESGENAYRGIGFSAVSASFQFTNLLWNVPALRITRPEGVIEADGSGDQHTGDFRGHLRSGMDLMALRPLFPGEKAGDIFQMFEFGPPPLIEAEVTGNWSNFAYFGASGQVTVTNASFREQTVKSVNALVRYTNQFLSILKPLVRREGESGQADGLGIDLATQRLYLTNASGNLHPMVVARAIGNHIVRIIEPYVFDTPPMLRVSGEVPLRKNDGKERMSFDIDGGRFHWKNIHMERARGLALWEERYLTLTNLQGRWHGGVVEASAHFDFKQPRGGRFSFQTKVDGADLKAVVMDAQRGRTNRIEGIFGGELVITQAYCHDLASWFGHGRASLRDGLLWDIPIFGVFSHVLNGIVPGLGNSRAKQGSATFRITNSIIHSTDLEIRATAMRMQYEGTSDFDTRVEARMEAELFRDTPGLGVIISRVLWPVTKLFEYRVTGTIGDPRVDPIWGIPRVIFFPFQPIKTLKDIFGVGEKKPAPSPSPSPDPPKPPPLE